MKELTPLAANPERVRDLLDYLIAAFETYYNEVSPEPVNYMDAFMAAHNFHKALVLDLCARTDSPPRQRSFLLRLARDTFSQAMDKELIG